MAVEEKRYLGIDWGEARIGLSFGDSSAKTAVPGGVVKDIEAIIKIIKSEDIKEIIIGEPLSIANARLNNKQAYNKFFAELKDKAKIPIKKIDERLTSKAADALTGDKKTKASRDEIAAMIILQSFLDNLE